MQKDYLQRHVSQTVLAIMQQCCHLHPDWLMQSHDHAQFESHGLICSPVIGWYPEANEGHPETDMLDLGRGQGHHAVVQAPSVLLGQCE